MHFPNKGAEALQKVIDAGTLQIDVAAKLKVASGVVTRWVHHARVPTLRNALLLERYYGIPVQAWHKPLRARRGSDETASG